jgi:hypothetical protein
VIPLPRDPENQGIDCSYSPSLERYTRWYRKVIETEICETEKKAIDINDDKTKEKVEKQARKRLFEILNRPENSCCADCNVLNPK